MKMRNLLTVALGLIVVLGFVGSARAALITNVTINEVSSEYINTAGTDKRLAVNTINESGLTTDGTGTKHDRVATNMWLSDFETTIADQFITFDLGSEATYNLTSFHLWNYNEQNNTDRSANIVKIEVASSVDSPVWRSVDSDPETPGDQNWIFPEAPGSTSYYGVEIDLSADDVRLIRFDIQTNHGDGDVVGLSEVQFYGTEIVPPRGTVVSIK